MYCVSFIYNAHKPRADARGLCDFDTDRMSYLDYFFFAVFRFVVFFATFFATFLTGFFAFFATFFTVFFAFFATFLTAFLTAFFAAGRFFGAIQRAMH